MSDDEDEQQFQANWDVRAQDVDEPTNKTWRQLLLLPEEERVKELMKRFRETHKRNRDIQSVQIENELMPIIERIPRLSYKNPDMMVVGYAVLNKQRQIDTGILENLVKYLESESKQPNIRSSIIRYARLLKNYI